MLLSTLIKLLITNPTEFILAIFLLIVPLLFSIAFHEAAHGFTAYKFGDDTPKLMGRLTLNPFAHLDIAGTLLLFIIGIGWAKPVLIDYRNIKTRTQLMLIALAGPASNLLLAVIFTFLNILIIHYDNHTSEIVPLIATFFIFVVRINLILAIFNMMPIPPLDGSKVLMWFLPEKIAEMYEKIAPYGMGILILLMFTVGFSPLSHFASELQGFLHSFILKLLTFVK